MTAKQKKRLGYALAFVLLVALECAIALWVRDRFIRPYLGDVIAALAVYAFARIWVPEWGRLLPIYIFLFCFAVEGVQYFHLADRLGLSANPFLRILLGATFDWADVACYFVGCLLLAGWEVLLYTRRAAADPRPQIRKQ